MALNKKAWYDKAYVCVSAESGSEVQLRAKTTSLNITGGNFDIESIDTFGGQIKRIGRRDDFEISFDGVVTSLQDFDWMFHGVSNTATSITTSAVSDYRLCLLWTDQSGVTDAAQAITTSAEGYREIYAEANMVSCEKTMDAGEHLTASIKFKLPFEDSSGTINFKKQVCDTTSTLAAVASYTSTVKF